MALARALVVEPPVLLLDEPLGALDRKLRKEMQGELRALNRELGMTFVYVTHDQEEALTMSDRVAVMADARIAQIGSPIEVYERPRTAFVAGFLGEANIFEEDGRRVAVRPERMTLRRRACRAIVRVMWNCRMANLSFSPLPSGERGERVIVPAPAACPRERGRARTGRPR